MVNERIEWSPLSTQVKPDSIGQILLANVPLLGMRRRPVTTLDRPLQYLWTIDSQTPVRLQEQGFTTVRDILNLQEADFVKLPTSRQLRDRLGKSVEELSTLPHVVLFNRALKQEQLPVFPQDEEAIRQVIDNCLATGFRSEPGARADLWKEAVIRNFGIENGIPIPSSRLGEVLNLPGANYYLERGVKEVRKGLLSRFGKLREELKGLKMLPSKSIGRVLLGKSFVSQVAEFEGIFIDGDQLPPVIPDLIRQAIDKGILSIADVRFEHFAPVGEEKVEYTSLLPKHFSFDFSALLALDLEGVDISVARETLEAVRDFIEAYKADSMMRISADIAEAYARNISPLTGSQIRLIERTEEEIAEQKALGNNLIPEVLFEARELEALAQISFTEEVAILYQSFDIRRQLKNKGINTFGELLRYSREELAELLDGGSAKELGEMIEQILENPDQFDLPDNYFQNLGAQYRQTGLRFGRDHFANSGFIDDLIQRVFNGYKGQKRQREIEERLSYVPPSQIKREERLATAGLSARELAYGERRIQRELAKEAQKEAGFRQMVVEAMQSGAKTVKEIQDLLAAKSDKVLGIYPQSWQGAALIEYILNHPEQ